MLSNNNNQNPKNTPQKKIPNTRMSFAVTEDMKTQLDKMAVKSHIPTGELVRRFVERGMNIEKSKDDIDFIRRNIREELESVMERHMSRIIKLLIKIGTMSVAMCFFTSKLLYALMKPHLDQTSYDTFFDDSKHKAAAYLGVKDSLVDEAYDDVMKK